MKFTSALTILALTSPVAYGRRPSRRARSVEKGGPRRHLSHRPHSVKKDVPGRHLREQPHAKETEQNKAGKVHKCGDPHPFPILESGCPCFKLDTIVTQMNDVGTSDGCEFYESHYDYDDGGFEQSFSLDASSSYSTRSDPPTIYTSSGYFYISMTEGPEWNEATCYASVNDNVLYAAPSSDYHGAGEDHSYSIDLELTSDEYYECVNVMEAYSYQLPASCTKDGDF